jgi:uncharacterized protein (TIGR03437 family)
VGCYVETVVRSFAALAVVLSPLACAQFTGLATTSDGSEVFFASTLKLKRTNEPPWGKLFVADESGVRLVRSRDMVAPPPGTPPCNVGIPYAYLDAQVSGDGQIIAATMESFQATDPCTVDGIFALTDLISPTGDRNDLWGVRLSPAGRYAIAWEASSSASYSPVNFFFLNLQTGAQIPIAPPVGATSYQLYGSYPSATRTIADDGTAILVAATGYGVAFVVRPGAVPQPFPAAGFPAAVSADGTKVLYRASSGLRLFNLGTSADQVVTTDQNDYALGMSDDGQRILFLRNDQNQSYYIVQTDGTGLRALTNDSPGIATATLSGDGKIAYAVTAGARLIKIYLDNGVETEIIGRTPYLNTDPFGYGGASGDAGLAMELAGAGFSDVSLQATPPLPLRLGNLNVSVGRRRVPLVEVTPASIRFLVPWDVAQGNQHLVAETPGIHSPFDFPETNISVFTSPRAGIIADQNWDAAGVAGYNFPIHVGDIIHVLADNLGAVSPEVPIGDVAPTQPLSWLAQPMVCADNDVLFAGLAPGYVERVYQVDLRLGNTTGYHQINCSISGQNSFIFLSLNVLP